jgi:Ca2+-binding RTX toxin-like protein
MAAVGVVSTLSGGAVVIHPDGTQDALTQGSNIAQGDVVATGAGAALQITFVDGTTLSLGESSRIAIDAFVYDPGGGVAALDLIEGLFVVVTGEIAGLGPEAFRLTTPVATIGVRGTSLAVLAAPEGERNLVTLLEDPDEELGTALVANEGGRRLLDEVNETTAIASLFAEPSATFILSAAQLESLFGAALSSSPFHGTLGGDAFDAGSAFAAAPDVEDVRREAGPAEAAEGGTVATPPPIAVVAATPTEGDAFATSSGSEPDATGTAVSGASSGASAFTVQGGGGTTAWAVGSDDGAATDSGGGGRDDDDAPPSDGGGPVPPDTQTGGVAGDTLVGTSGRDVLIGGGGNDQLEGRGGADSLAGGDGDDSLLGGEGNDALNGGPGEDTALFGDANGPLVVALVNGPQSVGGGLGFDTLVGIEDLSGGPFDDRVIGDGAANNLQGREGDDTVSGEGGDDTLFGDEGNDRLEGGGGSDFLVGGVGGDTCLGGAGPDFFAFEQPDQGTFVAGNVTIAAAGLTAGVDFDRILDFAAGDLVGVNQIGFELAGEVLAGVTYSTINVPFNGTNAEANGPNSEFAAGRPAFIFSTADDALFYDANGAAPGYTVLAAVNVAVPASGVDAF